MYIHHKDLNGKLVVDSYSGISLSSLPVKSIKFADINAVVGYRKKTFWGIKWGIGLSFSEKDNQGYYVSILEIKDEFKYAYFLEKIVEYLKSEYSAVGGERWATRLKNSKGKPFCGNNLYRSYTLCQILVNKMGFPWFDHSLEDEYRVVRSFFAENFIAGKDEERQIRIALGKTKFQIKEDRSVDVSGFGGFHFLSKELFLRKVGQGRKCLSVKATSDFNNKTYSALIPIFNRVWTRLLISEYGEGEYFHEFKKQVLSRIGANLNLYVERYCEDLSDGKIDGQLTSKESDFDGFNPALNEEIYHIIRPRLQVVWMTEKEAYGENREAVISFFQKMIELIGADVKPYAKVYYDEILAGTAEKDIIPKDDSLSNIQL